MPETFFDEQKTTFSLRVFLDTEQTRVAHLLIDLIVGSEDGSSLA